VATGEAASNSSLATNGSWVGRGDQTHSLGGLQRPPFLLARRFHTMWPVYFGLARIPRTAEPVHRPTARRGSTGSGGGCAVRSVFNRSAISS
jgi:hypothetical protein